MSHWIYISDGRVKFALYYLAAALSLIVYSVLSPENAKTLLDPSYLKVCILMGAALSIDVMIVTISLAARLDTWQKRFLWCMRVAAWHTILPLLGLAICVFIAAVSGNLSIVLGISGAALLLYLYYNFLSEILSKEEALESEEGNQFGYQRYLREFALVFAVSLDSALFGPTLIGGANQWTDLQLCVSYLTAGLVVGLLGSLTALIGGYMGKSNSSARLEKITFYGEFAEHVIISYFGWNAVLIHGFGFQISDLGVFCGATVLALSLFYCFRKYLK